MCVETFLAMAYEPCGIKFSGPICMLNSRARMNPRIVRGNDRALGERIKEKITRCTCTVQNEADRGPGNCIASRKQGLALGGS